MPLWLAAVLFAASAAGMALVLWRMKDWVMKLAAASLLLILALTLAFYIAVHWIFLDAVQQMPPELTPSLPAETGRPTEETSPEKARIRALAAERVAVSADGAARIVSENPVPGSKKVFHFADGRKPDAREGLNDAQKIFYDAMLEKTENLQDFYYSLQEYGPEGTDNVLIAATALQEDHPEIEMYFRLREERQNGRFAGWRALYLLPFDKTAEEPADKALLREERAIFDAQCDEIVRRMPENLSAYDRYRYLAAFLSLQAQYDYAFLNGRMTTCIYGPIGLVRVGICQGYARAFEYLCRRADLFCETVRGILPEGEGHLWNLIRLEDGTYHVDVTLSDTAADTPEDAAWFRYFAATQESILRGHEIVDGTEATGKTIFPVPQQ